MKIKFKTSLLLVLLASTLTGCSSSLGNFKSKETAQLSRNQFPGVAVEGSRLLAKVRTVQNRIELAENLKK